MASIKCKACGRGYNYREHEICPKCGAYNRPPHRMRVGFDKNGSVELLTEKEFLREAELFDARDDVCAEGQARKVRAELIDSETLDTLGKQLNKWGSRMESWWAENSKKSSVPKDSPLRDRKKGKSTGSKAVAVLIAVSIFASLFGTILDSCSFGRAEPVPVPEASVSVEAATPVEVWSDEQIKDALTRHGVTELVEMGTVFDWEGLDVWVSGWEMTSDNTVMVIGLNTSGVLPETATQRCFLVWGDSPEMTWAEFTVSYRNGALIFDELYTTLYEETKVWLLCENYEKDETTGEPFCTGITAVTLN